MLQFMEQEGFESASGANPAASPSVLSSAASFAGLLASLTAPKRSSWPGPSNRSAAADGLEDDVATLSYERALHTHARYKPPVEQPAERKEQQAVEHQEQPAPVKSARVAPVPAPQAVYERSGKRASVTVRMSKAEYVQLQQRAIEAGMTVSAYLRSCTFEAESLRAQVKQALAELKEKPGHAPAPKPQRRFGWLRLSHRTAE